MQMKKMLLAAAAAVANAVSTESVQPGEGRSATDNMVQNLLGAVANVASGKNREILLRKKAHLAEDSNPLVDAADTLGQHIDIEVAGSATHASAAAVSDEEARERKTQAWKDQSSWTMPRPALIASPARHRVSSSWASTAAAELAPAKQPEVSLWASIGHTAKMFGVTESSSPASLPPVRTEFLSHSRNVAHLSQGVHTAEVARVSSSLDSFSFEDAAPDATPALRQTVVANAQSSMHMSHGLASWLGVSARVMPAKPSEAKAQKSTGNPFLDDLLH